MISQNAQQGNSGSNGPSFLGQSFRNSMLLSPLQQAQILGGKGQGRSSKKSVVATLSLTSLIDAFSIIVIYLLIATTSSQFEMPLSKKMQLPQAMTADPIEETPMVRFEDGKYFVNEKIVEEQQLSKTLFEVKKLKQAGAAGSTDFSITVQADTKVDFNKINPLLVAASEAGIQKIKFAVVQLK